MLLMPHASCYSLSSSGVRLDYNVALGLALALNSCLDNFLVTSLFSLKVFFLVHVQLLLLLCYQTFVNLLKKINS